MPLTLCTQSIAAMLGGEADAPRSAKLSPKALAFNGWGPNVALASAGGVGLALALLSRAETADQVDESLDALLALMEGSVRGADQALRLGACRVVSVLLRRKLEFLRESTILKVIRFSGLTVGDASAVISSPDAMNDLIFARGLWKRASPQLQAKMYQMLSAGLCGSEQHAYNALRLTLIGGFLSVLRAMSDETLPEDALHPLLSVVKMHLRKHMRAADLSDVLMCVMSSLPHAEPSVGTDSEDMELASRSPGTSAGNGGWGKGPAASVRRVQVHYLLRELLQSCLCDFLVGTRWPALK